MCGCVCVFNVFMSRGVCVCCQSEVKDCRMEAFLVIELQTNYLSESSESARF